jgi:hypothetical protein
MKQKTKIKKITFEFTGTEKDLDKFLKFVILNRLKKHQ